MFLLARPLPAPVLQGLRTPFRQFQRALCIDNLFVSDTFARMSPSSGLLNSKERPALSGCQGSKLGPKTKKTSDPKHHRAKQVHLSCCWVQEFVFAGLPLCHKANTLRGTETAVPYRTPVLCNQVLFLKTLSTDVLIRSLFWFVSFLSDTHVIFKDRLRLLYNIDFVLSSTFLIFYLNFYFSFRILFAFSVIIFENICFYNLRSNSRSRKQKDLGFVTRQTHTGTRIPCLLSGNVSNPKSFLVCYLSFRHSRYHKSLSAIILLKQIRFVKC